MTISDICSLCGRYWSQHTQPGVCSVVAANRLYWSGQLCSCDHSLALQRRVTELESSLYKLAQSIPVSASTGVLKAWLTLMRVRGELVKLTANSRTNPGEEDMVNGG